MPPLIYYNLKTIDALKLLVAPPYNFATSDVDAIVAARVVKRICVLLRLRPNGPSAMGTAALRSASDNPSSTNRLVGAGTAERSSKLGTPMARSLSAPQLARQMSRERVKRAVLEHGGVGPLLSSTVEMTASDVASEWSSGLRLFRTLTEEAPTLRAVRVGESSAFGVSAANAAGTVQLHEVQTQQSAITFMLKPPIATLLKEFVEKVTLECSASALALASASASALVPALPVLDEKVSGADDVESKESDEARCVVARLKSLLCPSPATGTDALSPTSLGSGLELPSSLPIEAALSSRRQRARGRLRGLKALRTSLQRRERSDVSEAEVGDMLRAAAAYFRQSALTYPPTKDEAESVVLSDAPGFLWPCARWEWLLRDTAGVGAELEEMLCDAAVS